MVLSSILRNAVFAVTATGLLSSCGTIAKDSHPAMDRRADNLESVEYPEPMHGLWMPVEIGCPQPLNHDSEYLLSIAADMMGQYENTTKPLAVEQLSTRPLTWRILSTFSTGSSEYDGEKPIVYQIDGESLTVDTEGTESQFIKCK